MDRSKLELSGWFYKDCPTRGIPEYEFERCGFWRSVRRLSMDDLKRIFGADLLAKQDFSKPENRLNTEVFWRECAFHSSLPATMVRTTAASFLFYTFSLLMIAVFGAPH